MNTVSVCHIHDRFVDEWRRAYPSIPAPVPQCVRDISLEGDRLQHRSASVSAVANSLDSVNQRIARLCEELGKENLVKRFLTRVLSALREEEEKVNDGEDDGTVDARPLADKRRAKNDTGPEPGLVSGQTDNTRVVKGGAVLFSSGYAGCDCVHSLAESCSLCAVPRKLGSGEDVFDKLSPDSLKFISKIEISGDNRAYRQGEQPPHFRNSWAATAHHDTEEGATVPTGKGVDSVISRSNSVPDQDMFRKPKVSVIGGAGHDEEAGRHKKVGSKDNFLAVSAKHVFTNENAKNSYAVSGSPKLNRHYQMLKLTPGHEFVFESDADNDKATKPAQAISDPIRHGSAVANNHTNDEHNAAVEAKFSNRAESPNFKTSTSRAGVSIISVENTKKAPDEPRGDSLALSDPKPVDSPDYYNSTRCETETRNSANDLNSGGDSTPFRQQSVKKSPVPPPVAKKPVKLTSSNQLSPGITGQIAFPKSGESSPDVCPPPLPARGSLERKGFPDFAETKTCVSDNTHSRRDNNEDRNSVHTEQIKVPSPSPLVAELKTKYVDRQNSWPNELQEERARREVTTCGVLDNLAVYREGKQSEFLNRPKSEEILGMISFKPSSADDSRQKVKFGVGGLVENMKTNFGLARAKFQDSENLSEQGGDSCKLVPKRSSTPPVPPPRSPAEKPEIVTAGSGVTDEHGGSFRRMSSSTSTDTITEFNRKTSYSSDFDVKEALSTLDTLLTYHSSEDMELPEGPDSCEKAGRQKFRIPSYENWTIDRTLTSSISPMYVDSLSDDDELDGTSISPAAASPFIKRHSSPTGSKDSGLCDETTADQGDSVFDGDLPPGRILSVIKKLEEREEEASDQCDSLDEPPTKFVDYGEVVGRVDDPYSDFVCMRPYRRLCTVAGTPDFRNYVQLSSKKPLNAGFRIWGQELKYWSPALTTLRDA
ncbi:hypothetical protein Btru_001515 [Bulinus truncatus]|nr:hypothetical protein Btru_001515 [Bulinus truncatus]